MSSSATHACGRSPRHHLVMTWSKRRIWTSLAVVALSAGLAACGSSSKPASQSPETSTTAAPSGGATSSEATSTTTSGSAAAAPVAVCTTFPTAQVATLSGLALTSNREQDAVDLNSYTCDYFTATGTGGMSITILTTGGATSFENAMSTDTVSPSENVTPVTGIGDKAFSATDGLRVLFGDRLIYVAGLKTVPPAEAIVQAVQAKLP